MHGILLVDKPEGITSNEVVRIIKSRIRPAKVGHTGTLDPAATGLMVILIGAGTRALDYLDESRKRYELTVLLGEETDTGDRDGSLIRKTDASGISLARIEEAVSGFQGVLDQVPPHYSAIKKEGVPLYKLARKGIFPDLSPRVVEVFSLVVTGWNPPLLELDLICSKGTYARSLARDIGNDISVGGRLERLRRIASGPFNVEDSVTLDECSIGGAEAISHHIISLPDALAHIPDLPALPTEIRKLIQGAPVAVPKSRLALAGVTPDKPARLFKIVSGNGGILILVRPEPKGSDVSIRPVKVFHAWKEE
ncbi:MAG: tRNA pseudouridine(55) synthase TruB [Desulfomonilaceae bacterium]